MAITILEDIKGNVQKLINWLKNLFRPSALFTNYEQLYRQRTAQLIDYYQGRQLTYLYELIGKLFTKPYKYTLHASVSNIVRYIIDSLASTFKFGALLETENEKDQELYDRMLDEVSFDSFLKQMERMVLLCKTIFVKVTYIEKDGKMNLSIITPEYVSISVSEDNPLEMISITYPKNSTRLSNSTAEGVFAYWNENEFYMVNENNVPIPSKENELNVNPYGIIPVQEIRDSYPISSDFITWQGDEMITAQDALNIKITELNTVLFYQGFAQPVFRNPGINEQGTLSVIVDPSMAIVIKDSKEEPGDFFFRSPDANITEMMNAINAEYARIFSFYGLSAADFVQSADARSADAIRLMNAKLDEYRANAVQVYIPQLLELVEIMRVVWNVHHPSEKISEDYVTMKIQRSRATYDTIDDMIKDIDWRIKNNFLTPVNALLLLEDDLTEAEAEEKYKENQKENKPLIDAANELSASMMPESGSMDNKPKVAEEMKQ